MYVMRRREIRVEAAVAGGGAYIVERSIVTGTASTALRSLPPGESIQQYHPSDIHSMEWRPRHFPTSGHAAILDISFVCVDGAQHYLGRDVVNIGYSTSSASHMW